MVSIFEQGIWKEEELSLSLALDLSIARDSTPDRIKPMYICNTTTTTN
jgi:hypothetical protein